MDLRVGSFGDRSGVEAKREKREKENMVMAAVSGSA